MTCRRAIPLSKRRKPLRGRETVALVHEPSPTMDRAQAIAAARAARRKVTWWMVGAFALAFGAIGLVLALAGTVAP